MFLSNSKWEEIIRLHSLQVEEDMMVEEMRHNRIDEEAENDGENEDESLLIKGNNITNLILITRFVL